MRICDGCGVGLPLGALHYTVSIEVKAAYDTLEISLFDLVRDHRADLERLAARMKQAQVRELEEQVYKRVLLDLCPSCQRRFIRAPLGFSGTPGEPPSVDADRLLRSLGYGHSDGAGAGD